MKAARFGGGRIVHETRIQALLADLEWERRKGVLVALLPYSGDRQPRRRFPDIPAGLIPMQRPPLSPGEKRRARVPAPVDARIAYLRSHANPYGRPPQ